MDNLLYLAQIDISRNDAYTSKILGQIRIFSKNDLNTKLLTFSKFNIHVYSFSKKLIINKIFKSKTKYLKKIQSRIYFFYYAYKELEKKKYKFLYFRYPRADLFLLFFLIFVKIKFGKMIKILSEIPTYPYKHELKLNNFNFEKLFIFLNDRILSIPASYLLTRYVVVAYNGKINNVETINIDNGINSIDLKNRKKKKNIKKKLNFILVANFNEQNNRHGVDRLIKGLINYRKNSKNNKQVPNLHLVGDINITKKIVKSIDVKNSLKSNIIFHDKLNKKEINNLYNKCDLGIGNLAFHRIKVKHSSSLKEREYLQAGLPIVSASKDYCFNKLSDFRLQIPSNDTSIKIQKLIKFVQYYKNFDKDGRKIKTYIKENLLWEQTLKNLVNYLTLEKSYG